MECSCFKTECLAMVICTKDVRGAGACTLIQLLGTVTGDPLTEGIGTLKAIAHTYRSQVPLINHIIRVNTSRPIGNVVVKLPHALDTGRAVFKQDRLMRRVGHALESLIGISHLLPWTSEHSDIDVIYGAIDWDNPPPKTLIEDLWECTPSCAADKIALTFMTARSVNKVLSLRDRKRVSFANQADLQRVTRQWITGPNINSLHRP